MSYTVVRMSGKEAVPINPYCSPPVPVKQPIVFDEANSASFWARHHNTYGNIRYKYQVRPIRGDREWKAREKERFKSGHYTPVPWHKTKWAKNPPKRCAHHFPHIAQKDSTQIAFTESKDKGEFDKKTMMNPRKYLNKFYSKTVSKKVISRWLRTFRKLYGPHDKLLFAYSANEIRWVYRVGPHSCMKGHKVVGAYAGPDLAVAYVKRKGKIIARSVVWPQKKLHTRIYGNIDLIKSLLEDQGYRRGKFTGAKLSSRYDAPSLDCADGYHLSKCGKYWVLR